ncbi:MAG: hypothetical protein ACTSPE_09270 [Candidatus Thorarchaeota archaeon]
MAQEKNANKTVIKVETAHLRLPRLCPVCGSPATRYVRVAVGKGWEVDSFAVPFVREYMHPLQLQEQRGGGSVVLRVPVCGLHEFSNRDMCRLRLLCVIGGSIVGIMAWIGVGLILNAQSAGDNAPMWAYLSVAGFAAVLGLSFYVFRPSLFERSFRIVAFDPSLEELYIELPNGAYRDAFLSENPHAELVDKRQIDLSHDGSAEETGSDRAGGGKVTGRSEL